MGSNSHVANFQGYRPRVLPCMQIKAGQDVGVALVLLQRLVTQFSTKQASSKQVGLTYAPN